MFEFKKIDRSNIGEFKKNYLRNVVIQVKFDKGFEIDKRIEEFKETFKEEFPRFKKRTSHSLNVTLGENETPIIQPSTKVSDGFDLRSESGNQLLTCNADAITLNIAGNEYKTFEQMDSFLDNLQKLLSSCGLDKLSRVSIRKINIIDFNIPDNEEVTPYQLMEYILNKDLVRNSEVIPSVSKIQQSIQNLVFQDGLFRLNLRYGMVVNPIQDRSGQILIDIDCINENSITIKKDMKNKLSLINNEIFNIFNWCLSEDALKELL